MKPTPDEISRCLVALDRAFGDCEKPKTREQLTSVGGIDGIDAMLAWEKVDRTDIPGFWTSEPYLEQYIDHLSSDAVRHFFPALLSLALCHPEVMEESGLRCLSSRLKAMILKDPSYRYYRGASLTPRQSKALQLWCDLMVRMPDSRGLAEAGDEPLLHERTESLATIAEVRTALDNAGPWIDFDLELQKSLAETESLAAGTSSRRRGWLRHKGKDGRSRAKRGGAQGE